MLLIGLIIRPDQRRPRTVPQRRVGLGGVSFTMYKFRTMRAGSATEMLRELIAASCAARTPRWMAATSWTVTPGSPRSGRSSQDQPGRAAAADQRAVRRHVAGSVPPCLEWEARMFPRSSQPGSAFGPDHRLWQGQPGLHGEHPWTCCTWTELRAVPQPGRRPVHSGPHDSLRLLKDHSRPLTLGRSHSPTDGSSVGRAFSCVLDQLGAAVCTRMSDVIVYIPLVKVFSPR